MDGRVARTKKNRTEDEKNFGIQLDSLCDVICFGVFPAFEIERLENGMEYCMNTRVDEVVFGIAWATDYEGTDDVRVWFAADPTVYFKR